MPKKERKKKKPILRDDSTNIKHFNPTAEKQILFKGFSISFQHWTSWQRKILLCRCTSQSSLTLLATFSTIMEPVFHRDYQIINFGCYKSHLIKMFSDRSFEEDTDKNFSRYNITPQNKNWYLPILQQKNELFQRDKIANAFIVPKNYFDDIELNEMPERDYDCHSHTMDKHKDSVSTLDFFWKYKRDKIKSLGSFVKAPRQSKGKFSSEVSEYKHKTWFLPPINSDQSLEKATKEPLLKSFKESLNEIIVSYSKWTNAEQGDFILTLLRVCSPEELIYLGNCIQQRLKDFWDINRLSDQLLLKIFDYLNINDLYSCSQACRHWKYLAFHNSIWKTRCYNLAKEFNQFPVLQYLESVSTDLSWKNIYQELNDTVNKLITELVLQPSEEHFSVDVTETNGEETSHVAETFQESDETLAGLGSSTCSSLSSLEEEVEVLHLSPTKSFATFESDPSKQQTTLTPSATSKVSVKGIYQGERNTEDAEEIVEDSVDYAFDVRPKLVQPANKLKSDTKVLKKAQGIIEEEQYVHVPIQGVTTLKRVRKLQGHLEAVLCLQFDKKRVMTGSLDRTVRLWDIRSGRNFYKLKGHKGGVRCLRFDKDYIITGSWDSTVMIWHIFGFTLIHTITDHLGAISCLELTSSVLLTGSHDCTVCVFERDSWKLMHKMSGHSGPVSSMSLVSDERLLTGSHDMRVILWDYQKGNQLKEFCHSNSPILTVKACGNLIVAGCLDGTLSFWNIQASHLEGTLQAHNGAIHAVCFVANRFVTGGADGLVKEWDLLTCTCVRSLIGHKGPVLCVRASPKRIVSASADGTVRIWDMVCALQQVGGPYDEMNKIIVPSEVINEREWRDRRVLYEKA